MRHLRKDLETPGGLRPGLLGAAAAALTAALALSLAACGPRAPSGASAAGASWYQLASSVFQPVSGPGKTAGIVFLPWTVQARVTDLAFLDDTLYGAVNGAGIAAIRFDSAGAPTFTYYYDLPIFAHRTITTLIPRRGDLAIHLYYNALLNDVKPDSLLLRGICLVSFLPGQRDFSFLIPPFQRKNPSWEAVGFAPLSENEFDLEWKYTDSSETKFRYTRFRADLQVEAASTRDDYIAALGSPSLSGAGVPASLAAFFQASRARLPDLSPQTALHFRVRSREVPIRRYFRSDPLADSILVVPVFEELGDTYALLPEGKVLRKPASGDAVLASLPPLPAGFRYTDIVKASGFFVIPWEKTRFTEVADAGILVLKKLF